MVSVLSGAELMGLFFTERQNPMFGVLVNHIIKIHWSGVRADHYEEGWWSK